MKSGLFVLVSLVIMVFSGGVVDALNASDYTDPAICGGCHDEIYEQWKGSMHANAHVNPLYQKLYLMASEETDGLTDTYCAACHTPIGVLAGEIPPADGSKLSEISKKGVQCDFCHTINGSTGIGNAAYVSSPGDIKRGPFNDSYSPFHGTAFSDLHTRSEFCGMCHDVYHPVNGLPIEQTYTEWKESPYNTGDPATTVHCQDCHMRQMPGLASSGMTLRPDIPGRAAAGSKMREHIFTHYFVGGNAVLPGLLGSEAHNQLAVERLQHAATIEIISPSKAMAGEALSIKVNVTNSGAGHKLPTGLTEARQAWLEVLVVDGSGKVVYHSGALDENNMVEEGSVVYHTVLGDKEGKRTIKVWEAEQILLDNRIPPGKSSIEEYSFLVPRDVQSPLNITVKLNYQSASQELVDMLLGEGEVKVPTIEMVRAVTFLEVEGAVSEKTTAATPDGTVPSQPGFAVLTAMTAGLLAFYVLRRRRVKNK